MKPNTLLRHKPAASSSSVMLSTRRSVVRAMDTSPLFDWFNPHLRYLKFILYYIHSCFCFCFFVSVDMYRALVCNCSSSPIARVVGLGTPYYPHRGGTTEHVYLLRRNLTCCVSFYVAITTLCLSATCKLSRTSTNRPAHKLISLACTGH